MPQHTPMTLDVSMYPHEEDRYYRIVDRYFANDAITAAWRALAERQYAEDPEAAWDYDPRNFWEYVAYITSYRYAEDAWAAVWQTSAWWLSDDEGPDSAAAAYSGGSRENMRAKIALIDRFNLLHWLAPDGEPEMDAILNQSPVTSGRSSLDSWCGDCDSWYDGDRCDNEVYCDHCGSYTHEDLTDHMDYCTEDCDCRGCEDRRFGDPNDDQGWVEDLPAPVPSEAPEGRRRFGIEVEYNSGDRSAVVNNALNRGIPCSQRSYTHETVRYWKLVEDTSVTGGEFVSPIMKGDDESIEQVLEVIRAVKDGGGVTGSNCGMHVHVDVTDFSSTQLKTLAKNLERVQKAMEAFCAESRFNGENSHCTRMNSSSWSAIHNWLNTVDVSYRARTRENRTGSAPLGRYYGFNFNSLLSYGSIEVRMLGHTLNTVKVKAWIRICQAVFVASMRGRTIRRGTDMIDWLIEYGDLDDWSASKYREIVASRDRTDWLVAA